jgi:para-nitrobenzyl esterase
MGKINVKCKAGNISGSVKQGINFFYGIPYAKPLTKKTQWQPPEKLDAEILFEATKRGLSSPQTIYQESFLTDLNMPDQSIDCLSLNIASKNINGNMPVMIWIHGGAYITGSANSAIYTLDSLPRHEVVLVAINYRLGPFGFLKLDEISNGKIQSTGNEGLMDQKLAIEWVKENIAEFGGDPDNITIFGESAGAWSVALQSSISPSGNLFSKAICQSGGMNAYFDKDRGNEWGELFLKTAYDNGLTIKDLLSVDHKQVTALASMMKHTMIANGKWLSPEVGFAPIADGNFLPIDPMKQFQDSPIKLIVGTTSDEYRLWSEFESYYLNLDKESFYKRLNKMFRVESVDEITRNYLPRASSTDQYKKALSNIMTDWTFGIHALELLELHQGNTYGYLFNEPSPVLGGKLGAYHASELPYVFGSATKKTIKDFCSKEAQKISNFFQVSWTQFAKTGSPSSDLMYWDTYDINQSIAFINSTPKIKTLPNIERIKLLHESKTKL